MLTLILHKLVHEIRQSEHLCKAEPYLNQVLVHPFCESLLLYSVSFICKTETRQLRHEGKKQNKH